jgi:hypothetical protein
VTDDIVAGEVGMGATGYRVGMAQTLVEGGHLAANLAGAEGAGRVSATANARCRSPLASG